VPADLPVAAPPPDERDYSFVLAYVDELVTACEEAFAGAIMDDFKEDEDVMSPPSGITFGMIRRARGAVEAMRRA
jgi:hypothetical protein